MSSISRRVVVLETRRRRTQPERTSPIVFVQEETELYSCEIPPTARVVLPEKSESIVEWVAWVKRKKLLD